VPPAERASLPSPALPELPPPLPELPPPLPELPPPLPELPPPLPELPSPALPELPSPALPEPPALASPPALAASSGGNSSIPSTLLQADAVAAAGTSTAAQRPQAVRRKSSNIPIRITRA